VTASVDGLMCVINTLGEINDDDGLDMVNAFLLLYTVFCTWVGEWL
jgi:hypothetical protein